MRRYIFTVLLIYICLFTGGLSAQDSSLVAENVTVLANTNIYGQEILAAEGQLINNHTTAYTNITLFAEVYDADNELVGEGIGYLVNACGTALIDTALQPGESRLFSVSLELYEADAVIDRVDIIPQADETEHQESVAQAIEGITLISTQEVVAVEWLEDGFLRFGAGCAGNVFTEHTWYEYDTVLETQTEIPHPKTEFVTEAMLRQTGLEDPLILNHALLSFAPNARRMVYQTDINALITAEPDGSFKRVLYEDLSNRSLQGINWLSDGNFLAYYFGAYGEPVYYVTASVEGRPITGSINFNPPSVTIPGATPDGLRVIIGGTFGDMTGYFLKSTVFENLELLFEAELPGNNWPAPLYSRRTDGNDVVYVARPVEGEARLQCFNINGAELHDLTSLPLTLATDERAWIWLSPDATLLALAANGVNGGLWLIDLTSFEEC